MVDLLVSGGTVVTMDADRRVIEDGAVAIEGREVVAVGTRGELEAAHDADRRIDAAGHAVLPGLIDAHVHVNDVLLRGLDGDRSLFDWLLAVNKPGSAVMTPEDHAVAGALFCREAIASGITCFVDNAGGGEAGMLLGEAPRDARLDVYDEAGMRAVYAQEFVDRPFDDDDPLFERFLDAQVLDAPSRPPEVAPIGTEEALDRTEALIADRHGTCEGRLSVWPAPLYPWGTSPEGLRGAYRLAERYEVMCTTHVSEVAAQERGHLSVVEYLDRADYLGERTLLGHCVHVSESDVRRLAASGTKVSHNVLTNCALGSGVAPVPTMHNYGVTVGLGTDNTSASDTVNLLNDVRFAALVHRAHRRDAGAVTAEKALEMATVDGARAIGRGGDLGSIEPGKLADLVLVDLDRPHLAPVNNVASALVMRAQGSEVETVICNGEVIMEDGRVPGIDDRYPDLVETARRRADRIVERAGLEALRDREWTSISGR